MEKERIIANSNLVSFSSAIIRITRRGIDIKTGETLLVSSLYTSDWYGIEVPFDEKEKGKITELVINNDFIYFIEDEANLEKGAKKFSDFTFGRDIMINDITIKFSNECLFEAIQEFSTTYRRGVRFNIDIKEIIKTKIEYSEKYLLCTEIKEKPEYVEGFLIDTLNNEVVYDFDFLDGEFKKLEEQLND